MKHGRLPNISAPTWEILTEANVLTWRSLPREFPPELTPELTPEFPPEFPKLPEPEPLLAVFTHQAVVFPLLDIFQCLVLLVFSWCW